MLFIRWKVMHGVILTHGWYCVLFSKILELVYPLADCERFCFGISVRRRSLRGGWLRWPDWDG